MTLTTFLKNKPYLIWHIPKTAPVSESAAVEAVLNYGDFKEVKEIIKILGLKRVEEVFRQKVGQPRNNYRPEIKNYFNLFFNKYAR